MSNTSSALNLEQNKILSIRCSPILFNIPSEKNQFKRKFTAKNIFFPVEQTLQFSFISNHSYHTAY
jgi:hypothetical protein